MVTVSSVQENWCITLVPVDAPLDYVFHDLCIWWVQQDPYVHTCIHTCTHIHIHILRIMMEMLIGHSYLKGRVFKLGLVDSPECGTCKQAFEWPHMLFVIVMHWQY